MQFHEILRLYRAESGLSFQQLSQRAHVDVAYLHRLERGHATRPGRNVILRIALGLGLTLEAADQLLAAGGHLQLAPDLESTVSGQPEVKTARV